MAYIDELHDLCDFLGDELKETNKKLYDAGKMTAGDLDYVDKLTHAIKSLKTTIAMEEYGDDNSGRGRSYTGRMNYGDGNSYRGDNYRSDSYARRGRSRDGMTEELRNLMHSTNDPHMKQEIERLIDKMER